MSKTHVPPFARHLFATMATLVFALTSVATVAASSPELRIILPRGIQRGTAHQVNFHGERLQDVEEVLFFEGAGFEVQSIEIINDKHVRATVMVKPDCRLGEHVVQLRARSGLSEFLTIQVEAYPVTGEVEPNGSLEEAQSIGFNQVIDGIVENEDVDYYVVEAKQGQRISAEVVAIRLGDRLFDPYLSILDSKRFELAADDDTPLARQDPIASIVAPEDGKYYIEVRESSYGGDGGSRYRLHIGTFPRPTAIYPAGGKIGETVTASYVGDPAGELAASVTVPTEFQADFGVFPEDQGGIAPTPLPFRPFPHGNVLESEPNNDFNNATPAELPLAFNGRISEPGDVDCFKFAAKKGQVLEVECYARRLRTGLDSVVNLYYADGRGITGNDDSRGPDSYFRFEVPEDGEYIIRVTDHLGRGQADFVYRIEMLPIAPSLSLSIPRVARYSQYRQSIFIPRGNRFATLVTAARQNFGGEIVLDDSQLPEGVTMIAPPMRSNLNSMPVVFEAAADAPVSGKVITWTGRVADENQNVSGIYTNSVDAVRGPPNQDVYYPVDVNKIAFAVVDEVPFRLEIVQPKAPLVRNGTMNLKVIAHRNEGFDGAISMQFPFRPPGVGAGYSIDLPAGQSEIDYQINANGNAQLGDWPVYVIGAADVNGQAWVASQMASLTISEPFVTMQVNRAGCEQGQETQIVCNVTQVNEFEGEATVSLLGVPPNIEIPELTFTKETEEVVFTVKTSDQSPVGQHKNLIARVTVMSNGEPVYSDAGVGELQIDKPLPVEEPKTEKPAEPQPAAETPPAEQPKAKPLTRLEKIRLEAQKRREQAEGKSEEG